MLKRTICIILITAVTVMSFSSCKGIKSTELSERLIIEAIGIDSEDGKTSVTVQALNIGGNDANEGNEKTKIYNFQDSSTGTALLYSHNSDGLVPLYSQARILIIGKDAAKNGIGEILDFFLREYTVRSDILIAVAEDKASEIIKTDFKSGNVSAAVIEDTLEQGREKGKNIAPKLYKFISLLLSEDDCAVCPIIGINENKTTKEKTISINGSALFKGNKMCISLTNEETQGIMLLTDKIGEMAFTVKIDKGNCTVNTIKSSVKIETKKVNDKMFFTVKTDITCDVSEITADISSDTDKSDVKAIENAIAAQIEDKEKRVLEKLFIKNGFDICRFRRRTLLRYPKYYEKYILSAATMTEYEFSTNVTVRRTGRRISRSD